MVFWRKVDTGNIMYRPRPTFSTLQQLLSTNFCVRRHYDYTAVHDAAVNSSDNVCFYLFIPVSDSPCYHYQLREATASRFH